MASNVQKATCATMLHGTRKAARLLIPVCCEQTVRNLCERGELKAIRSSSGRYLISQADIDRYNSRSGR